MRRAALFVLAVTLGPLGGCMPESEQRVPVRGQVRLNGRPLAGGVIAFASDQARGNGNELAVGQIQMDGSFQLEGESEGAVSPGWYRVTVAMTHGYLPEKYRDPVRSGLECEILAGHENIIELDLKQ